MNYIDVKWLCVTILVSMGMWNCTNYEIEKMRTEAYQKDVPMCGYEVPNEQ